MVYVVADVYKKHKKKFEEELKKTEQSNNLLVILRTVISLLAVVLIINGFSSKKLNYVIISIPLIVLFIVMIIRHNRLKNRIGYLRKLIHINQTALLRLESKWTNFSNSGKQFTNHEHPYSSDLNIFGQGSLYQCINATTSFMGSKALYRLLSMPPRFEEIQSRQEAIKELAGRLDWRQHFQAIGMNNVYTGQNPAKLLDWAEENPILTRNKAVKLVLLLPLVSLGLFIMAFIHLLPAYIVGLPLLLQLISVVFSEKYVYQAFATAGKASEQLECYSDLLTNIEQENFQAPLLVTLKEKLITDNHPASYQIKLLYKLADRITLRYSPIVHFIVNITTFWDLYTLIKLEKWKKKAGLSMHLWFEVVGDMEALSSVAILAHDNPDWVIPKVTEGAAFFEAVALGHPLINNEQRICNNVNLSEGTIFVITGSNMSGKSTLMRTIGINLVLAYAGAPVCAQKLSCSLMEVYTSMQVHDNLVEKISTFYAELNRTKMIIDAAKNGKPFIFLLDEIFKGTNSRDRILGAKAVIMELIKCLCIGLVTTHDLEISVLEKENPDSVKNYHFTDKIIDDQIEFDYKLKLGVSISTNAIALMKIIGIDVGNM